MITHQDLIDRLFVNQLDNPNLYIKFLSDNRCLYISLSSNLFWVEYNGCEEFGFDSIESIQEIDVLIKIL